MQDDMGVPASPSGHSAEPEPVPVSAAGAASTPNAEETNPVDAAPFGALIWHSSGEDEGPDVGVSIKLGDEALLWCGEITNRLYEETEGAEQFGGPWGWWVILYDGPKSIAIAKCCDGCATRDAFDRLSALLRRAA